jgi:peptide/nickel transport system permease protein
MQDLNFKKQSKWKEVWRLFKKNKAAMIGLVIITILVFIAIFADFIAPYKMATHLDIKNRLQAPSSEHWLGTDGYGRDLFARVLHGGRVSLTIGFATSIISLMIGGSLGAVAGYLGGRTDNFIMRILDVITSIPGILLSLAIVAALGPNIINLVIAISIARIPAAARIVRSSVLNLADQEFIEAAHAGGTSNTRIIVKHIIPNAIGPIIVQTTMGIASMILMAASLSFIGMGVQAPRPEWGSMLSEAREFLRIAPYFMIFPGVAIVLATLSLNLVGDGLRDALDPRLKS